MLWSPVTAPASATGRRCHHPSAPDSTLRCPPPRRFRPPAFRRPVRRHMRREAARNSQRRPTLRTAGGRHVSRLPPPTVDDAWPRPNYAEPHQHAGQHENGWCCDPSELPWISEQQPEGGSRGGRPSDDGLDLCPRINDVASLYVDSPRCRHISAMALSICLWWDLRGSVSNLCVAGDPMGRAPRKYPEFRLLPTFVSPARRPESAGGNTYMFRANNCTCWRTCRHIHTDTHIELSEIHLIGSATGENYDRPKHMCMGRCCCSPGSLRPPSGRRPTQSNQMRNVFGDCEFPMLLVAFRKKRLCQHAKQCKALRCQWGSPAI